jgi:hypothetical protein
MIASGSRPARLRRRGWLARSGNSWRSVSTAQRGSVSAKPSSSGATPMAKRGPSAPAAKALAASRATVAAGRLAPERRLQQSSSASRGRAESAATSTRPG